MANWDETGKDTEVSVNGTTVATTTTNYTITYDTSVSDMDNSPTPSTAIVSRYAEGSMEWDGSQLEAHGLFINPEGDQVETIRLLVQGTEYAYRMTDVTLTSLDKEESADSHTAGTIEWRADNFRRING